MNSKHMEQDLDNAISDILSRFQNETTTASTLKDEKSLQAAISKLEEVHVICISQLLDMKPKEDISIYTDELMDSSVESQVKFSVCGHRLAPSLQKQISNAILPANFCQSLEYHDKEPCDIVEKYAGCKRKGDHFENKPSTQQPSRQLFNIASLFLTPPLVPLKGDVDDMPIANLRDFWSWIDHQQYFSLPPVKDADLENLQFCQPSRVDIEVSESELSFGTSTSLSTSSSTSSDVAQSVFYQRLLGCLVVDESVKTLGSESLKTERNAPSSATKKAKKQVRSNTKKFIDISELSLEERTKLVFRIAGIFDQDFVMGYTEHPTYVNMIDDEVEFTEAGLLEIIQSLSDVEHSVNQRIAHLRCCMDDILLKTESDIRKSRDNEKLIFTRWQKYLKRQGISTTPTAPVAPLNSAGV